MLICDIKEFEVFFLTLDDFFCVLGGVMKDFQLNYKYAKITSLNISSLHINL